MLSATPSSQPAQLSRLACCCSVALKLSSSLVINIVIIAKLSNPSQLREDQGIWDVLG